MSQSLPDHAHVLVATGELAKVFRQVSSANNVSLNFETELSPGDLADEGPAGKSPPERSASESMEATFSKILSEYLYKNVHSGEIKDLVIVADPGTLGEMRPLLHKEVEDVLILDLGKTLINSPVEDLEKSITSALSQ